MRAGTTRSIVAIGVIAAALVAGACTGAADMATGGSGGAEPQAAPERAPLGAPRGGDDDGLAATTADYAAADLPSSRPSVIKTGSLELEVGQDEFHDSVRDAISVAERYGGFVLSTSVEDEEAGTGTVVLRVPAGDFERAFADLQGLGDVKSEVVTGEDVSQEFVDLEARLRNFEAQEVVLLRLMRRAVSVTDTIRVQRELQGIQLEIERIRGRLRFLEDRTAMGTIDVRIAEVGAAANRPSILARAVERASEVALGVVATMIVALGFVIPVGAVIAIVTFAYVRLRPRVAPGEG